MMSEKILYFFKGTELAGVSGDGAAVSGSVSGA